jgi:hypothetical protein
MSVILFSMTPQFRIAWSVPATGVTGHGEYCLSYESGQSFLHSLKKHTDMEHWMEEEGSTVKIYASDSNHLLFDILRSLVAG